MSFQSFPLELYPYRVTRGRVVGPVHPKQHQTRQGCLGRMHVGSVGGINAAGFDIENAQPSIWTSTKKDYFGIGKMLRQEVHESDSRLLSH